MSGHDFKISCMVSLATPDPGGKDVFFCCPIQYVVDRGGMYIFRIKIFGIFRCGAREGGTTERLSQQGQTIWY